MRTLIVDDVEADRELLNFFLKGRATTISVGSGEEALGLVGNLMLTDSHFDLICMDIGLPGISGHETLKCIRELEAAHGDSRAKVFMITGSSDPNDMLDALVVGGCDDYLVKPLMAQKFMKLLVKHGLVP